MYLPPLHPPGFDLPARKDSLMFTLLDPRRDQNCQGFSRREFLKIGSLALLGGMTLPHVAQAQAAAAAAGRTVKDKSVVLLFLSGGPSHIEFFDPKMAAPAEIRSITGEVQTRMPGITFAGSFPKMAAMADKLAIVRSYASGSADHTYLLPASGGNPLKATMSALYARVAGVNDPRTGIPNNILILPEAVQRGMRLQGNFETGALPTLTAPGELGASYRAFDPSGSGEIQRNMELRIPADRFDDRRHLLSQFDNLRRDLDDRGVMAGADRFQQQAFDVIRRGVAQAFDLSREDPRVVARYDTSRFFRNEDIQRYYDMRRASNLLGKQMLLARRLCEAGCGFVTVSDCGWDMHANNNSPRNMAALPPMAGQVDHAVATFLEDFARTGLERQDSSGRHRRNGPHAAPQQQRRPRSSRQPDDARLRRRRLAHGPGDRPLRPHGRRPSHGTLWPRPHDGDDHAHAARYRRSPRPARTGPRRQRPQRGNADPGVVGVKFRCEFRVASCESNSKPATRNRSHHPANHALQIVRFRTHCRHRMIRRRAQA